MAKRNPCVNILTFLSTLLFRTVVCDVLKYRRPAPEKQGYFILSDREKKTWDKNTNVLRSMVNSKINVLDKNSETSCEIIYFFNYQSQSACKKFKARLNIAETMVNSVIYQ